MPHCYRQIVHNCLVTSSRNKCQITPKLRKKPQRCSEKLVRLKRNPFRQAFQGETNNHQEKVLETTTKFPLVNIFELSNNKDGREIQQAKQPINKMVRLQKKVATFCNISVEPVPLEKLEHVHPLIKEKSPGELKPNIPLGGRISPGKSSQKIRKF